MHNTHGHKKINHRNPNPNIGKVTNSTSAESANNHKVHHSINSMDKVLKGLSEVMEENHVLEKEVSLLIHKDKEHSSDGHNITSSTSDISHLSNTTDHQLLDVTSSNVATNSSSGLIGSQNNGSATSIGVQHVTADVPALVHSESNTSAKEQAAIKSHLIKYQTLHYSIN